LLWTREEPVKGIFEYEIHDDDSLPWMMASFAFMRKALGELKHAD
jgi:hypothetical protein